MPGDQTGKYGGPLEKFWAPHKISTGRDQPGNPRASNELPSSHTSLSPSKAKEILKHGSVRGHELTQKQEGFLGAVAGKGKKK